MSAKISGDVHATLLDGISLVRLVRVASGVVVVLDLNAIAATPNLEGVGEAHLDAGSGSTAAYVRRALVRALAASSGESGDAEAIPGLEGSSYEKS